METVVAPTDQDIRKIKMLARMRTLHFRTVNEGSTENFRRRQVPVSAMPALMAACCKYPELLWAPKDLLVPETIPKEAHLPKAYMLKYYGTGKLVWDTYFRSPITPEAEWDPSFDWNGAFPKTDDGWENPTSDETFTRLRLQGPNPWILRRVEDRIDAAGRPVPTFAADFTALLAGVLPPIIARFELRSGSLAPLDISVDGRLHHPGDPTWDRAKRVVNAADVRYVVFGRHLLDTHLVVGQAFALAAFALPTWHPLRPFMQFFTYASLAVTDLAYRALLTPSSYFMMSGFVDAEDARNLFSNAIAEFDLDQWIVPRDLANRGLDAIEDHPYAQDAALVWPAFEEVVERHLWDLGLDDEAIAADLDLQSWYYTLAKILPNTEPQSNPLTRERLADLCSALIWNNVVHEVCGDLSPILGSDDPADKVIVNLEKLRAGLNGGALDTPIPPPSVADVFLMDQASYVSRFNVGGNSLLTVNAAKMVDDPKLRVAIEDMQATLTELETEIRERNNNRAVRFNRMRPSNWEASISF